MQTKNEYSKYVQKEIELRQVCVFTVGSLKFAARRFNNNLKRE